MAYRILLKATGCSGRISREVNLAHILRSLTACGSLTQSCRPFVKIWQAGVSNLKITCFFKVILF